MDCLFCKIINKELPSTIVYEDDKFLAIKDIFPKAPVHILVIPKRHIASVNHLKPEDKDLTGELILLAKSIAKGQGIADSGYRLSLNAGKDSGQTIDHLHLHLMGGGKLPFA